MSRAARARSLSCLQVAQAQPPGAWMEHPQIEVRTHTSAAEAQAELQRKVREIVEAAEKSEGPAAALAARNRCQASVDHLRDSHTQIGRASCRERV